MTDRKISVKCFGIAQNMELRPCIRCGSEDLWAHDFDSDGFCMIHCSNCRAEHLAAFPESAQNSWNAAKSIDDYRPFLKQKMWPEVDK